MKGPLLPLSTVSVFRPLGVIKVQNNENNSNSDSAVRNFTSSIYFDVMMIICYSILIYLLKSVPNVVNSYYNC